MHATADDLRGLHDLHRRGKALRNLMESAPKTLAARKKGLETREKALEEARAALKASRAGIHKKETIVAGLNTKLDDLRVKLSLVKKNEEYKAILNQIAHDQVAISKHEDKILEEMATVENQAAELAKLEAEVQRFSAEVAALQADIEAKIQGQRAQLQELEVAIRDAEAIIPPDHRDAYRRVVKQRGDDAFAAVDPDAHACTGCFLGITPQGINDLINAVTLCFCKSCGRVLYLSED
ncbi:hypothetical protein BH23PLA1_BH23PLA1_07820 [soil metagenome]